MESLGDYRLYERLLGTNMFFHELLSPRWREAGMRLIELHDQCKKRGEAFTKEETDACFAALHLSMAWHGCTKDMDAAELFMLEALANTDEDIGDLQLPYAFFAAYFRLAKCYEKLEEYDEKGG